MLNAVQIDPAVQENRRYGARRALRLDSVVADSGAEIVIHDISATGLLIETAQDLAEGETLLIDLPERGATAATIVWRSGHFFGCRFELSIPVAAVSAALLRSPGAASRSSEPMQLPGTVADATIEVEEACPPDDRYPLRTRALAVVGLAGLTWALVGMVAALVL
jgi:PilZ domain